MNDSSKVKSDRRYKPLGKSFHPRRVNSRSKVYHLKAAFAKANKQLQVYRNLAIHLPCIQVQVNAENKIYFISQSGATYLGKPIPELMGANLNEFVAKKDEENFQIFLAASWQRPGQILNWSGEFLSVNGATFSGSAIALPGSLTSGKCQRVPLREYWIFPLGWINLSDATAPRSAKSPASKEVSASPIEQMLNRVEVLQSVLDKLPLGIWITDAKGKIIYGNAAVEKIWGGKRYIGRDEYNQYKGWWVETGQQIQNHEWPINRVLDTCESEINQVIDIESFDGKRKTILNSVVALQDNSHEMLGTLIVNLDITEQRLVEKALWENQRLIQQIADATPAILYLYDIQKKANVYSNRKVTEILGYAPQAVANMDADSAQSLVHPDDYEKQNHWFEQLRNAKDGEIIEIEYRMLGANGEWHWLHSRDTIFTRTGEGEAETILGIATDISDRKRAEAELIQYRQHLEELVTTRTAELTQVNQQLQQEIGDRIRVEEQLRESEQRLSSMATNLPGVIYRIILDPAGEIQMPYISAGVQELLGLTPREIMAQPQMIWERVHPEDRVTLKKVIHHSAFTHARLKYDYRIISTEGPVKWVRAIAHVHQSETGEIIFDGLALDLTAYKVVQQAFEESEARNRALIAAIPDTLFRIHRDGTYLDLIPSADLELFLPQSALFGKKLQDVVPPGVGEQFNQARERALATGSTQQIEFRLPVGDRLIDYEMRMVVSSENELLAILRDISDRKQTEEALRESEERFRSIFNNISVGIALVDQAGYVLMANDADCRFLGYSPTELIGKHFREFTFADDLDLDWQLYQELINCQRESYALDKRYVRKDGAIVWGRVSISLIRNREQLPVYATVVCEDISDRKRTEQALQRSERLYRTIAKNFPNGVIFLFDQELRYLVADGKGLNQIHLSSDFFEGKILWEVLPLEVYETIVPLYRSALAGRTTICEQMYLNHLYLIHCLPVREESGEILAGLAVWQDISDRKRSEIALQQSEERFRQLAENLTDVFWMCTADRTQMLYVSPAYQEIWGESSTEISDHPLCWLRNLHGEDRDRVMAAFADQQVNEYDQEYRICRPNGSTRWIRSRAFPVRDQQGEIYRIAGISQDITERKKAAEERDRFFNLSIDLLVIFGFDGYAKRVNPAVTNILGYTAAEFLSVPFLEFVHPDDQAVTLVEYEKLLQGISTLSLENRYRCQDGSYKWLAWTAVPFLTDQLIYAVARDITERRKADEALRESREKYRALFEILPIGIAITDEVGNLIEINQASQTIIGFSQEQLINLPLESETFQCLRMDGTPLPISEYPSIRALRENIILENLEIGMLKPNQEIVWLSITAAPIPLKGYGVVITYTDISDRKKTTEQLYQSEQKFRTLAENIPDIIARFDRELHHLYVNPAAEGGAGISVEQMLGKTNRELGLPDPQVSQWETACHQVLKTGKETSIEFDFVTPTGIRNYQAKIVPEFDNFGSEPANEFAVKSVLCITRDITDRVIMEQSIRVAQARLEHLLTASPAVIYSCKVTEDYGATFMSNNIQASLGYSPTDFITDSHFWATHIHPEDQARVWSKIPELLAIGHGILEYRFQHQDGSYRWMYDELQLLYDETGNPQEFVGCWIDITDRKQAEEQLIRISKAVEGASDAIAITDLNWKKKKPIYHNPAFVNLFGYTVPELAIAGGPEIIYVDHNIAQTVFTTIQSGNSWSGEVQMRTRDGKILDILIRAYAIANDTGDLIGLVGVHTDITERKRSLQVLQEREMRFRTLAETVTAAIFISQGHELRYVNSAAEVLTGYNRDELLAGGTAVIHPAFAQLLPRAWVHQCPQPEQISDAEMTSRHEFQLQTKTGTHRWIDFSVALMEYEGSIAALSAAFDITDRKQAEEALQYRFAQEKLIGDISTHFLNVPADAMDPEIHRALGAIADFIGVERSYVLLFEQNESQPKQFYQWPVLALESETEPPLMLDRWEFTNQTLQQGEAIRITDFADWPREAIAERTDLSAQGVRSLLLVPLLVSGSVVGAIGCHTLTPPKPWTDDHITLLRIVGEIFVNGMERRRALEEKMHLIASLQEQAADLARSNADLEQFAYVASHDLQEPLRMVASYTELLAKRYGDQLDAKAHKYIAYAVDGAKRMQQLIEDLLQFSRVGTRAKPFIPVNCQEILATALSNLRVAIRNTNAVIHCQPLPTVMGDDTQLVQLFQNLIGNAIKYRTEQSPIIHIGVEHEIGSWRFWIRDNGIGIDPKYSDRIFLIFQRLHTREEYPGTGIGLAICKKIVERHGGRIWVESSPNQGATFYFTLADEGMSSSP